VYCRQTGHCTQGMVFAANAPATGNTFDAYLANAKSGSSGSAAPTTAGNPTSGGASPTGAAASAASSLTTGGHWGFVLAMLGVVAGMVL
jgi:hypothetical protein